MFDIKDRLLGRAQKKTRKDRKHQEFEHRKQLTTMLKVIHSCPMPEHLKNVMRTRIWGLNPKVFSPGTPYQVAYLNKGGGLLNGGIIPSEYQIASGGRNIPRESEIEQIREYERQGRFHCEQFLLSTHAQEIIDNFNRDINKNKSGLFPKMTFDKKSFSI